MGSEFGIFCLLPAAVGIALALITKQTVLSLVVAAWVGATMLSGYNPILGFLSLINDYMIPSIGGNGSMLFLVTASGGLIAMLRVTGAAQAFAQIVTKTVNSAKKGQIVTTLSAFIFCYTEPCLILGTIMRPVTDIVRVSRAKLAYILDSMGCNLASFSPISSYGPFITGLIATELVAAGLSDNAWGIWAGMLKFNMYSLFAMITVLMVAIFGLDFGPMKKEEMRARKTGKLLADGVEPLVPEVKNIFPEGYQPTLMNFIVPFVCLFGGLFATIFYTGNLAENGFKDVFLNANITLAISVGFITGGIGAGVVGVATKLFKPTKAFNHFVDGMAELINVPFILVAAWGLGGVTKALNVGAFMVGMVGEHLDPGLVPAIIFLFGAIISFATGSSWGVWSIMMPIGFPMAVAFDIPLAYAVGAVISGGMFGDQCSPVSDTTVLSSTGASCNHIVHVMTQLPYGIMVGASAFVGFLFGGLTGQYVLSIGVTAVVLYTALFIATKVFKGKDTELEAA